MAIREPGIADFVHFGLEPSADGYGLADLLSDGLAGFVFVRIEDRPDGFEGLVHTSELDVSLESVIEVGGALTVKILDVDLARRRITLSHTRALATGAAGNRTGLS